MKRGGDSVGRGIFGDKTFNRLDKFDPTGAHFKAFGHDAQLGDNISGGKSVSDSFRQRGREDMLGLRTREVVAAALAGLGGYYAAPYLAGGATGSTASTSAAGGTVYGTGVPASGGAAGSGYAAPAGTTGGGSAASGSAPAWMKYARMGNAAARGMQQRPQTAPMQAQQPMHDPYGLQASGLPLDAWQDPRMQIMQALLEQQQGVANG